MKQGIGAFERSRKKIVAVLVLTVGFVGIIMTSAGAAQISPANVKKADAAVTAARKVPKFVTPGPAFDASKADGKVVYVLAQSLSVPFDQIWSSSATAALAKAGVKTVVLETDAEPSMVGPFISQAVGAHASAIVVEGIPTGSITQPLADAKTAGIPVIKILDNVPQLPTTSSYAGEVTYCYACIARLEADWTIANGHGNVNTVTYWNIGTASGPFINSAMKAEYARLCPATCHISLESLLISNWATDLPTMTASDLIHQPAYNYFAPSYSDMLTLMAPSAKSSKAAAISFGVDTPTLTLLKKKDFAKALVGASATWTGWAVADQTLRILVGKSPVANENIPIRLFDSANIGTINVSAPEASWFGVNFQADYLKLWKIS